MQKAVLAAAAILLSAAPSYAQSANGSPQSSGGNESIIRTPPSSGASNGNSGNIGAPTSTYPAPLRDLNNPSVTYGNNGRFVSPNIGGGVRRR